MQLIDRAGTTKRKGKGKGKRYLARAGNAVGNRRFVGLYRQWTRKRSVCGSMSQAKDHGLRAAVPGLTPKKLGFQVFLSPQSESLVPDWKVSVKIRRPLPLEWRLTRTPSWRSRTTSTGAHVRAHMYTTVCHPTRDQSLPPFGCRRNLFAKPKFLPKCIDHIYGTLAGRHHRPTDL